MTRPPALHAVIAASFAMLMAAPLARAAVSVSPPRVVLQAKPKETRVGFFTVENTGDEPLTIKVEPEDWSGGMGGKRGAVPWLRVKPTNLVLGKGKSARVKFTVRVPAGASGELRAQVFFTTESGGGISMRSRLGAIIYVGVEGTERIEGSLTHTELFYTAATPGVATPDRLEVVMRIHNRGNAHIVPEGTIVLRDQEGRTVATIPLPPGWGLLPNEEDTYHAIGHGVHLKPGVYTVDITVECGNDLRHPKTITKTVRAEVGQKGIARVLEEAPTSAP